MRDKFNNDRSDTSESSDIESDEYSDDATKTRSDADIESISGSSDDDISAHSDSSGSESPAAKKSMLADLGRITSSSSGSLRTIPVTLQALCAFKCLRGTR